ncbi:hypothetical protein GLOIN_2v1877795 [Rhizophagus irregularis DAOM 181602=DAOM 197198]|nr:hypothetical protein GLOIN_2v1877795 [Rhizophagus irregularis DAOM 181602=DAOM 197198]
MNCSNLISGFNQFINLTKPFKLKSLIINKLYHIDKSLQLLLQKSGDYLENFRVGQVLPSKLEYLSLTLSINTSDFRIFLENSQNTFINKLKIMQDNSDDILHCIKEYIMKVKRVNYLAISNFKWDCLSYLKDEVKEFNLDNIKVLNLNDLPLAFDVYNLIRKIDYL